MQNVLSPLITASIAPPHPVTDAQPSKQERVRVKDPALLNSMKSAPPQSLDVQLVNELSLIATPRDRCAAETAAPLEVEREREEKVQLVMSVSESASITSGAESVVVEVTALGLIVTSCKMNTDDEIENNEYVSLISAKKMNNKNETDCADETKRMFTSPSPMDDERVLTMDVLLAGWTVICP